MRDMEIIKSLLRDLAIIGILAAFIEILVPEGKTKYPVRMIFGLYIIAIMLNPFLDLFHKTDLSALDFSELEVTEFGEVSWEDEEDTVLEEAALAIAKDVEAKLAAAYEAYTFTATVNLSADGDATVEITVTGVDHSREVFLSGEIKALIAKEFEIAQSKTKIYFK